MTESFRHEDASSQRVQLEDGQVEVFFDEGSNGKQAPVVLDTATVRVVVENTPHGVYEYEELLLSGGSVLIPADLSSEERIAEFGDSLEPADRLSGRALLRTVEYRRELKFLEIVRNDATISERRSIQKALLQNEQKRLPRVLLQQRELFDDYETRGLWLRLEAAHDPDKALVGKIIMARLAYFMSHDPRIGMTPVVYDAADDTLTRLPDQLVIDEDWLYDELK